MKKMKLLCAALTVIMLLTACSGSTSSAAEKVIGTTDKVVAADTLKPLAKADKEKLGYQLDMPEKGEEICVLTTNYGTIRMRFFPGMPHRKPCTALNLWRFPATMTASLSTASSMIS